MFKNVFVAMMLTWSVGQACGGVIVSVQNGTIAAGGTGSVDVYIRSSSGSFDLYSTSYFLEITGTTTNGDLIFRDDADQTSEQQTVSGSVPYVFYGNTDSTNWFATRQTLATELVGGDFTTASTGVSVGTTDLLLARLQLQHISSTPASSVGDTFTIALKAVNETEFVDSALPPIPFRIEPASYTNVGTFTILAGASAVPEPGGILASIAAVVVAAARYRRRGRV
jgi:hypothetical protein